MEAKDTVMNNATKRQFIYVKNKPDKNLRGFLEDEALLCQAEISFKAGMQEVLDFVEIHAFHHYAKDNYGQRKEDSRTISIPDKVWQDFLKENGLLQEWTL